MLRAWVAFCLWAAGHALAAGVAVGDAERYPLSRAFQVLEDPGGQLLLEDVLAPGRQQQFRPLSLVGPGPNFGLTASAFWLRVELDVAPAARTDWLLEVAYPPLDRIDVYLHHAAAAGYERQVGGDHLSFDRRRVRHRNHVFPLHLAAGTNVLYLRLQSEGTVSAPATLWRPQALWEQDQATYAALSLYFGLLLGLLLYNLLLWVSVRERAYLSYVAFVAAMGVGQAALSGLGAQFLWPRWGWWSSVSVPVGLSAAALLGFVFVRAFLSSAARMPRLDKVLLLQMGSWGVALLAGLSLPYAVSAWLVTLLAPLSVVTMSVVGWYTIRNDFAGARYFFGAWALLLAGVTVLTLHNTGVLPSNAFTSNGLLIGSALEMVLLSFALGDRMNVARRFKEQAQVRIAAEHAMVEALSQSQARLRRVLDERERILENSLVGIVFLTRQGRMKFANRAMLDMFGTGNRSITSMEPFYLSREQYLQVGGEVAQAVARGEVYERELPVQRWDGTRIWIQLSGKAVNRNDLDQGTVWVVMDITRRKQLEERLRQSESQREGS